MKISLDWIKDHLDLDLPLPQLVERLNLIGLVVETWEERGGDVVLDVETYANRPDTLGHLGMAREMAAALGLSLKTPDLFLTETTEKTAEAVDVQILDEDLCPRYCGLLVRGVKVGPSPDWLRRRIEAMGLKPINNAVDVSNYILFATSQPIHVFDLAKLKGAKVLIRRARKGERLRSLDGRDLELTPEMLIIADEAGPVALAGVIGGEESSVTESTSDIFIESAAFNPISVRMTRKALGIQTDASYRFERGSDISFPPEAARLAASLLCTFGGKAASEIADVFPRPRKKREILLRKPRVADLLGIEVGEDFIKKVFLQLGFELVPQPNESWLVRVPFFRVDIEREADLIEEVARFYGYDRIPSVLPPLRIVEHFEENGGKLDKVRHSLLQQGFDEVMNFSFADPEKESLFNTGRRPIEIRNPVSTKASLLRTTLIGGLLENISWNLNREREGVFVFEVGQVYFWDEEEPLERLTLALAASGREDTLYWEGKGPEADFFRLKGAVESVFSRLRYEPQTFEIQEQAMLEEGFSLALLYRGVNVGSLGKLAGRVREGYDLKKDVYVAELDLETLFGKQPRPFEFAPIAKYPAVSRDLSFVVHRDVSYQQIRSEVEKMGLPQLERYELIDRFSGSSIPKNNVSLMFRFIFRHPGATLVSSEVDKMQKKIVSHLHSTLKMQLREGGEIDK